MVDSTYFNIKYVSNLEDFINNDNVFYIKKIEPNYKIKVPNGLKSSENIYFLKCSRSLTDNTDVLMFSISRFYKRGDRTHVVIYSNDRKTGEITRFVCYSSISDGSFWRLCIKNDSTDRYEKGYNYISSSFMNIYLQEYIDYCKNKFEIETDNSPIHCDKVSELSPYLKNRIINHNYLSYNIFFNVINIIFPPITYLGHYSECISLILNFLGEKIKSNDIDRKKLIKFTSNIFCKLNKFDVGTGIDLTDETSTRIFYNKVKQAFSELFKDNFIILKESKVKIYDERFFIGLYEFWKQIYSVKIIHKESRKNFYLYYMEYTSSTFPKFAGNIAKNIIHIIPEVRNDRRTPNTINKYGLDDEYIAGGLMINKIFDYKIQAPISVLRGHIERHSEEYRYIGDLTNFDFLP